MSGAFFYMNGFYSFPVVVGRSSVGDSRFQQDLRKGFEPPPWWPTSSPTKARGSWSRSSRRRARPARSSCAGPATA